MTTQADLNELDTDGGPRTAGRQRMCAVTRVVRPVEELVRFVAGPEGVVPDLKRRLPGRGVWVTATRQIIAGAVKRGVFKRSLKADVKIPTDLPDMVERLLVRSALDALSIAHKAGEVVSGFVRTENAIAEDEVLALIHASDAGADGTQKLAAASKRRHRTDGEKTATVTCFTTAELSLALGRPNVVHAAVLAGPASKAFLARYRLLLQFRGCGAGPETGERCGS